MGPGGGFPTVSGHFQPFLAVSSRFQPAVSGLKAFPCGGPRAGISVHATPRRHFGAGAPVRLCAGISGQRSARKHLRAGTSVQALQRARLCAGMSGQWPARRHFCADNSVQAAWRRRSRAPLCKRVRTLACVQAPPCKQLRAGTPVQALPCGSAQACLGSGPRAGTSVHAARTSRLARLLMEMHLASLCKHLCAGTFAHTLKHATGPKCRAASPA